MGHWLLPKMSSIRGCLQWLHNIPRLCDSIKRYLTIYVIINVCLKTPHISSEENMVCALLLHIGLKQIANKTSSHSVMETVFRDATDWKQRKRDICWSVQRAPGEPRLYRPRPCLCLSTRRHARPCKHGCEWAERSVWGPFPNLVLLLYSRGMDSENCSESLLSRCTITSAGQPRLSRTTWGFSPQKRAPLARLLKWEVCLRSQFQLTVLMTEVKTRSSLGKNELNIENIFSFLFLWW